MLKELQIKSASKPVLWCDNKSAVYMTENPTQHARTKHIKLDLHFVRELVQKGEIEANHIPGTYQKADILTKAISTNNFTRFRSEMNVERHEQQIKPSCSLSKEQSNAKKQSKPGYGISNQNELNYKTNHLTI